MYDKNQIESWYQPSLTFHECGMHGWRVFFPFFFFLVNNENTFFPCQKTQKILPRQKKKNLHSRFVILLWPFSMSQKHIPLVCTVMSMHTTRWAKWAKVDQVFAQTTNLRPSFWIIHFNWFFGIYLNFQLQKSLEKSIYLPHSESKSYQIKIPLNPAHQDLSNNTKGTFQFLQNFQLWITNLLIGWLGHEEYCIKSSCLVQGWGAGGKVPADTKVLLVHDYFQGYWVFWWHNKDMKSRHVLHAWAHSLCTIAHSKLLYLYGS